MAALQIKWDTIEHLARSNAVITGDTPTEGEEAEDVSPFKGLDKPVVVLVADPTVALADFDKLEEIVFKNEKIGLAMKAFRAVRMSPEDAEADAILAGEGKTVPRMVVVDPAKESVRVIEEKKIKVSTLYKAMKSVSDKFYKERLDTTVKAHLKILNDRDKLHNEEKILGEKENKLAEDGAKAEAKLAKVRKELEELKAEVEELASKERGLWKLTPRHVPASA